MTKTQKSRIQLLVSKLKSTKKRQTTGVLKDSTGAMCALGFACEVYRTETGKGEWAYTDSGEIYFKDSGLLSCPELPPSSVSDWYGFGDTNPEVEAFSNSETMPVSELNDDGWSFRRIAAAIEKTYLTPKKSKK